MGEKVKTKFVGWRGPEGWVLKAVVGRGGGGAGVLKCVTACHFV
jgi:hypothetical protein